ncbi:YadA-like family protein, partial [Erythrobacter donghaensis]
AYGWRSEATAERATALGHLAVASGVRSVAVGEAAIASGAGAIAIGNQSSAAFTNSVAIGNGATANRANQIKLGGTGSSVTIGDLAASTAAQSGTTSIVTTDASGTLGAGPAVSNFATNAQVTALTGQVNTLFDLTEINRRAINRANEGVAMALAMESPALPAGTNFALSGGVGYYEDQASLTMAITARVGENASVSAGIGTGFNSGSVGARGGFQIAW